MRGTRDIRNMKAPRNVEATRATIYERDYMRAMRAGRELRESFKRAMSDMRVRRDMRTTRAES